MTISNDIVFSKIYDKRDEFDFEKVNIPLLGGDVPRSTSYGFYISQLIRFARASSHVAESYGDLVYKKKIVGSNNFSAQFIKIISFYKKMAITLMYCNRLHAWWSTQSWLATLLSSLIARRWSDFRLYDGSDLNTYLFMRW